MALKCYAVLLFTLAVLQLSAVSAFIIDFIRDGSDPNLLTLECLNEDTGSRISDAIFFLNRTAFYYLTDPEHVEERIVRNVAMSGNAILFTITQEIEGMYSCAVLADNGRNHIFSQNTLELVGK